MIEKVDDSRVCDSRETIELDVDQDDLAAILSWQCNNDPIDNQVDYFKALDEGIKIFMANSAFVELLKTPEVD
jgi:hypothetical protein